MKEAIKKMQTKKENMLMTKTAGTTKEHILTCIKKSSEVWAWVENLGYIKIDKANFRAIVKSYYSNVDIYITLERGLLFITPCPKE